jgi:hypothetical protein
VAKLKLAKVVAPAKRTARSSKYPDCASCGAYFTSQHKPGCAELAKRAQAEAEADAAREVARARFSGTTPAVAALRLDYLQPGDLRWRAHVRKPGDVGDPLPEGAIEVVLGEETVAVFAANAWQLAEALCEGKGDEEARETETEERVDEAVKAKEDELDEEIKQRETECTTKAKRIDDLEDAIELYRARCEELATEGAQSIAEEDETARDRLRDAYENERRAAPCSLGECPRPVFPDAEGCHEKWCGAHAVPCSICPFTASLGPDGTCERHGKRVRAEGEV